jgi:hypothetical protein
MARLTAAGVVVMGGVVLATTAGAQALTFTRDDYASDAGARAIRSADFDRDGWLDVAHANIGRNSVTILLNHGGSSLVRTFEVPVGAGPFDLATGDFNRDAVPDLAVANADSHTISILLGRGDGSFTRADIAVPSQNPRGIATGDLNNDGRPDLIYTGYATGVVQALIGNGAGGFTAGSSYTAAGSQPQGVATGDFNHDRYLDVVVASNSASGLRILYGTSGGSFTVRTIAGHGNLNVIAVGDLNGDGWSDVAAASTGGSDVAVYLGGASGPVYMRPYMVGASPRGVALGDVNGDGRLDVITANRSSSTVSVLAGDRAHPGAFLAHEELAAATGSRAVVAEDFDGDGRLDVATGNEYTRAVTVLANITPFKRAAYTFSALTLPSDMLLDGGERFRPGTRFTTADFNRDGRLDFLVSGGGTSDAAGVVVVLRDGRSVALRGPTPLTGSLVDDFNADGHADVLYYSTDPAATAPATRFLTYLGDGRGSFTPSPTTIEPHSLEWCGAGDLNRDRRPDLVCDNLVLLGNGNGTFRSGQAFASPGEGAGFPGPLFADINRDGKLDVVAGFGVNHGDGTGGLVPGHELDMVDPGLAGPVLAVADLNHDGYVDLVIGSFPDAVRVAFGSADGFNRTDHYQVLEDYTSLLIADVNVDGHPDIVLNATHTSELAGNVMILFGNVDGTFEGAAFALAPGPVLAADLTGDGLPDLAAHDAHAFHVLVNERNDVNHQPLVPDYSVTVGYPCVTLDASASDPDQHALVLDWFDASGALITSGTGAFTALRLCVGQPGTYTFRRTASDGRGGTASGVVTLTYQVTLKEIVLYAAADNVQMAGHWSRIADPAAAGGFRAYDRNLGAPKVLQPLDAPANSITIPFLADPNLTYKLWLRLKADANSWANDSVWVQFTGAMNVPAGDVAYRPGTTPPGLPVSLEECVSCGVSGWGWEDDGFGAVNKNGVLIRFEPGPQMIVIQTREDGVSIDQVVLSAEKYLTTRPGAAKNDRTILPATSGR